MLQGVKPKPGEERQSGSQISLCIPESMALELSLRVKARRETEPCFSRNDLVRNIFLEHFKRHPRKTPDDLAHTPMKRNGVVS